MKNEQQQQQRETGTRVMKEQFDAQIFTYARVWWSMVTSGSEGSMEANSYVRFLSFEWWKRRV